MTKKLEEKTIDSIRHMFACLVSYIAKCEFSSKLRVYVKVWSLSRGSGATVGLCRHILRFDYRHFPESGLLLNVLVGGIALLRLSSKMQHDT